ncbi:MAG: hypothetical protein AB7F22_16085 [Reyranella sp.]|uniref:hypothetical protein n=1 Tax=Reyranella sp. TaxID=1929291 RepID=UPI003D097AD3
MSTAVRRAALSAMLSAGCVVMAASAAEAGSQPSNTSSNSSSNNGVVRERVDSSYCVDGYCERTIERRTYRDDHSPRWRPYNPYYEPRPYR